MIAGEAGLPCCPSNSTLCRLCNQLVRNDRLAGHALVKACAHNICRGTGCANCRRCIGCRGVLTRDLCATCLGFNYTDKSHLRIRHQLVPGWRATVRRPVSVFGEVANTGSGGRETPPPPLVSGKTEKNDDIAELKQYDRGHLVALELGGLDDPYLIAPMNKEFNQSGHWRKMEEAIGDLINGKDQDSADGRSTIAAAGSTSTATFSLRVGNVLDTRWRIEVYLYYDDTVGDSRIPVWFYTRLFKGNNLVAHFSLGNRCGKTAMRPSRNEVLEFMAAKDLYIQIRTAGGPNATLSPAFSTEYQDYAAKTPPNQLLQFMHDVNLYTNNNNGFRVFTTFDLVSIGKSTAYKTFQRKIFKKFNRWKNDGQLKSDMSEDDLYEGEEKDRYQTLTECGGREAPEIDHIGPSYQSGMNSYINGRLVSFYHNHIYREKKVTGSVPVCDSLWDRFQKDALRFTNDDETLTKDGVMPPPKRERRMSLTMARATDQREAWGGKSVLAKTEDLPLHIEAKQSLHTLNAQTFLNTHFSDDALYVDDAMPAIAWPYQDKTIRALIEARKKFVITERTRLRKLATERALEPQYLATSRLLQNGFDTFVTTLTHAGRVDLLARIDAARIPLCKPSDLLNDAGISNLAQGDPIHQITEVDAKKEKVYTDVFAQAKAAGLIS
jgi:hypothetical protein